LASFYRDMLVAKTAPERPDLVALTEPTWQQLCEFVKQIELPLLLQGQKHLKQSEVQVKNTTQPRLWLEVTLLGLLPQAIAPVTLAPVTITAPSPQTVAPPVSPPATPTPAPQPAPASQPNLAQLLARINDSHGFANATASDGIQALVAALTQTAQQDSTLFDQVVGAIQGLRNGSVAAPDPAIAPTPAPAPQPATKNTTQPTPPPQQSPPPKVEPTPAPAPTPVKAPAPAPPAPIPAAQSAIPESQPNVNLEQLWSDILKTLQPPSTQMLLRQMGKLLAFDGRKAYIGTPQTWHAKIKDKGDAVAKAFSDHFGRAIAIEITVGVPPAASKSTGAAPPPSPPVPSPPPADPIPNAEPDPSVDFAPDPLPPPKFETTDEGAAPTVVSRSAAPANGNGNGNGNGRDNGKARAIADDRPPAIQSPKDWKPDDEVTRSAKQLADFFNGEIVYLDAAEDEEKSDAKK
ncbi:MAG: hypothetical protein AAF889_12180, partial [Cyanobacteria bacterium P01_D01_bin.73]